MKLTKEYFEAVEQLKNFARKNFTPLSQKKFYLYHGRNQAGEEYIAEYFKTKNYEIIRPEKLPFEEQLNILANCKNFASTLGSISHNSIFLNEGAETLFIPRFASLNQYQFALDTLQNLNVNYVDSTISMFAKNHTGPYCYIFSKQLLNFFGDKWSGNFSDTELELFLYYMSNTLKLFLSSSEKFIQKSETIKYYSAISEQIFYQLRQRPDLISKYGLTLK